MATDGDEDLLEATLNQYKEELLLVQTSLVGDQANHELTELRDKLIEIIALTEVDLIGIKKAILLAICDNLGDTKEIADNTATDSPKPSTSGSSSHTSSSDTSQTNDSNDWSLNESLSELNGKECRVPLSQPNGSVIYHNAIIMTIDGGDNDSLATNSGQDMKVNVFFTHPMKNSMLSCPHYLSAKCRFEANKCRYSHGKEVLLSDIRAAETPDYTTLGRDSICLAKNSADSLWYKAIVEEIRIDDQQVVVKYCDKDFVDTVDFDEVLPLSNEDINDNNQLQSNGYNLNDSYDGNEDMAVTVFRSGSTAAMAEWETHTKGIGSKLMAKMGYVWGQGLGRDGAGITEPIEAFVYPSGKSLDKCIELRDKYLIDDSVRARIKSKQQALQKTIANGYNTRREDSVFDFINNKVFANKRTESARHSSSSASTDSSSKTSAAELKTSSAKSLNVSSFQVADDIRKAESELQRLRESMARNASRDPALCEQLRQRVDQQTQVIAGLKRRESLIQREQNSRANKHKLSVF